MIRSLSVRRIPRPLAVVLSVALAAVALPVMAAPASAATGTFEIDPAPGGANFVVDTPGNFDWANVLTGPKANDNAPESTVFKTSSKENDPVDTWRDGNDSAPPKTDITYVYDWNRINPDNQHVEFAFAWERDKPQGTLFYTLELNKQPNVPGIGGGTDFTVPNRTGGDYRFSLFDQGNGIIELRQIDRWTGSAWDCTDGAAAGCDAPVSLADFQGRTNLVDTTWPATWNPASQAVPADTFVEVAFDLTDLIDLQAGCPSLSGYINFRSSTGSTSSSTGENLKDYIKPLSIQADDLCGSLQITKTIASPVAGDVAAGASKTFAFNVVCTLTGKPDVTFNPTVTITNGVSETVLVSAQLEPGRICTVTEPSPPAGWASPAVITPNPVVIVGKAMATVNVTNTRTVGYLQITKATSGSTVGVSTAFTFDVVCTVGSTTVFTQNDVPVTAGTPSAVLGPIPAPASCTVTEDAATGWTPVPPSLTLTVNPGANTAPTQFAFSNTRETGYLRIAKQAVGGAPGDPATFNFDVVCTSTVNSATVFTQNGVPVDASSGSGQSALLGPIPAPASCLVTEVGVDAALWIVGTNPQTVSVTAANTQQSPSLVTFNNTRNTGGFSIVKRTTTPVTSPKSFTVNYACVGDVSGSVVLTVPANSTSSQLVLITGVRTGVLCTVTEVPQPGIWSLVSITPTQPFAIGATTTAVVVTNSRDLGSLQIVKNTSGPVAGASTTFTFDVSCTYPNDVPLTFTPSITVSGSPASGSVTIPNIPTGYTCTVTEQGPPTGWAATSISGPVVIAKDATVTVTALNTRTVGGFDLVKTTDWAPLAATDFSVEWACTAGTPATAGYWSRAGSVTLTVPAGAMMSGTASITDIPTGASCTVTETSPPSGWVLDEITPSTFTVGDTVTAVTVANTRLLGSLRLEKVLSGPVAGAGTAFTFDVTCTLGGLAVPGLNPLPVVVTVDAGETAASSTVGGIPSGSVCSATEQDPGAAWSAGTVTPASVVIVPQGETTVSLSVTNTRTVGGFELQKQTDKVAPEDTTFTVDYVCTAGDYRLAAPIDLIVPAGEEVSELVKVDGIPSGVSCTFTEQTPPAGWTPGQITPNPLQIGAGVVTLVTVNNTRAPGELTIVKEVDKAEAEFGDELLYTLRVSPGAIFDENNVIVSDPIPAGVTYVADSAACVPNPAIPVCTPVDSGDPLLWSIPVLPAGETQVLTFKVLIDLPPGTEPGEAASATIYNTGYAESVEVPKVPSNEVVTEVIQVTLVGNTSSDCFSDIPFFNLEGTGYAPNEEVELHLADVDGNFVEMRLVTSDAAGNVSVVKAVWPGFSQDPVTGAKTYPGPALRTIQAFLIGSPQSNTVTIDYPPASTQCDAGLAIVKANTPTGLVPLGSTVTYTLTVTNAATNVYNQEQVVVTDSIPGYDPAVTGSGLMTYVADSAACDTGTFPCAATYDAATKTITWKIDQIKVGETRTLTFQATVDRAQPSIPSGQSGTVTLKNVAAVDSLYTDPVKSNEVQNTAAIEIAVLPAVVAATGLGAPIGPLALVGIVLVGMGVVFTATARRRHEDPLIEG